MVEALTHLVLTPHVRERNWVRSRRNVRFRYLVDFRYRLGNHIQFSGEFVDFFLGQRNSGQASDAPHFISINSRHITESSEKRSAVLNPICLGLFHHFQFRRVKETNVHMVKVILSNIGGQFRFFHQFAFKP